MNPRKKRVLLMIPLFLVGAALFVTVGGFLVRYLWNWLLPTLFGLPLITFWQALGILVLCRILFGFGFRGGPRDRTYVRQRLRERWDQMTPEERERIRQGWRGRWGFCPPEEPAAGAQPGTTK